MKKILLVLVSAFGVYAQTINGVPVRMSVPFGSVVGAPAIAPESFGALGNGQTHFDGVITGTQSFATAVATGSTTVTAPAITTITNNDIVLNIFDVDNKAWGTAPSAGTNRLAQTGSTGEYALTVQEQTKATAGTVASSSGTVASTDWVAATVMIRPGASSISFVAITSAQQSSGATISASIPTGTANGDFLIACVAVFRGSGNALTGFPTSFPSSSQLFVANNTTPSYLYCFTHIAASESGSYTWTQSNSSDGMAAFVINYRNVAALDGVTLTSASSSFTSAMTGDPICIAGFVTSTSQTCTTIAAVNSSTSISLPVQSGSAASSLEFRFGSDDTMAFQNTISSCTAGCSISLANKQYVLTKSLSLPVNIAVSITGGGPGVANTGNSFINSNTHPNSSAGTQLVWLTTGLTGAALQLAGTSHATSFVATDILEGFAIVGGAGYNRDGGGADGIDIINWQGAILNAIYEMNFKGKGLYIDSLSSNGYDYVEAVQVQNCLLSYNGSTGVTIGTTGTWIEAIKLDGNIIETNGAEGVTIAGGLAITLLNNTIQWNNFNGSNPEVKVSGGVGNGMVIQGNYIETDTINGSQSSGPISNTTVLIGSSDLSMNYFFPTSTFSPQSFITSALPAASGLTHMHVNVSDATACTNGTTLAGGSSTHCVVYSNGTNWIESGAGWQ